ncbi:MAG: hypothetical protein J6Y17_03525 [Elusimicrobiaceae bacterium]|nr:hypothetical protein [Elusimicrobiaceae bacterium]
MKKLALAILVGIVCLGATSSFAQTKKETTQEKILRLEVENRILKRENLLLQERLSALEERKPYYLTFEIQKKCEKYPRCKKMVEKHYGRNPAYQIISIKTKEQEAFSFPGFSRGYKTQTRLEGTCRGEHGPCFFNIIVAHDGKPIQ